MPHSTRKKRPPPQKRLQVTDANGWTHITTGSNARRTQRKTAAATAGDNSSSPDESSMTPLPAVAEAPRNLTLEELKAQFQACREKWVGSEAWGRIEEVVRSSVKGGNVSSSLCGAADEDEGEVDSQEDNQSIDTIISIGLGSPSGFLKGGWVDRRTVSMYQLAALVSLRDLYSTLQPKPPQIQAQDPVFNTLDKSLLSSLNINILIHPAVFTLSLSPSRTLLYCPGAEKSHLEHFLFGSRSSPALVVGGPLEDADSRVLMDFVMSRRESVRIPRFGACEVAFFGGRVYCA